MDFRRAKMHVFPKTCSFMLTTLALITLYGVPWANAQFIPPNSQIPLQQAQQQQPQQQQLLPAAAPRQSSQQPSVQRYQLYQSQVQPQLDQQRRISQQQALQLYALQQQALQSQTPKPQAWQTQTRPQQTTYGRPAQQQVAQQTSTPNRYGQPASSGYQLPGYHTPRIASARDVMTFQNSDMAGAPQLSTPPVGMEAMSQRYAQLDVQPPQNDPVQEEGAALEPTPSNDGGLIAQTDSGADSADCEQGDCGTENCDTCNVDCCTPCAQWYASAAVLGMTRDQPNRIWTTYETNNNPNQLMNFPDAEPDWEVGGEIRLGRFFGCNCWALELGYWSVGNFEDTASMTHANLVSSPLAFNDLEFAAGDTVDNYFNSAQEHRIYRSNELHNLELNLIEGNTSFATCRKWSHQMLVGVRYFKFDEDLGLASLDQGGTWGGNGGADEAYLDAAVENDLVGVQLGCLFQRRIGCRGHFFLTPKFGLYNNHIEHRFNLYRGDGTVAAPTAFSGVTGSYPVEADTDVVSFMTELNLGLQWQLGQRWIIYGGYRVVAINGIGLADNQIPQYIVDIPEIADIDTNGSLLLHGAFTGVAFRF
jgi:hypothetical protein